MSKARDWFSVSASLFAMGLALVSHNAQAQQSAKTDGATAQEIIVTGSRIARRDYVAQSPIVTTSAETLTRTGAPTVDNYLRELPQFRPGTGDFSNSSTGGTIGQSNLNLRGLGAQRNLVLMDGRRMQPSDNVGAIDINTVPSLAIGSIEVISGGASATYGSDAMSGVVNFKIRTDLQGLEVSAQNSLTGRSDGASRQFGIAYGTKFADGRGRLLLTGEYLDREGILVNSRDFFRNTIASGFIPQGFITVDATNLPSAARLGSIFSAYGTATPARTANIGVNGDGSLFVVGRSLAGSLNYRGSTSLPYIANASTFGYHGSYYNYMRSPLQRYGLFGRSEYAFNDHVTGYAQLLYSNSRARNIGSEAILGAGFVESVPVTNPFVIANTALSSLLASRARPTAEFQYTDRVEQVGPRIYQTKTDLFQGLIGLKGAIDWQNVKWDIYFSHGETRNTDATISGAVSVSAINRLTHAADGGNSLCAGGYNPFGLNAVSDSCIAYISRMPVNRTTVKQDVLEASANGDLLKLPAGNSKFALSGTWRRNHYLFVPDSDIAAGDIATISATQRTTGKIEAGELAAEAFLPVLADLPVAKSVNVTLGYRFSHYDRAGDAHTWKADFDWRVIGPLMVRGGWQKALRAPNIAEYFQAPTQIIQGIGNPPSSGDPCDSRSALLAGANAVQVRALCVATGLPSVLVGSFQQPTASIITNLAGNNSLTPETAHSFTLGAVLTSPFSATALRNISLSVDYYNIRITNAIATLNALDVLQKCFNTDGSNPTYSASNYFCQQIQRTSSGDTASVFRPTLNLGGYRTSGIDISFNWRIPLDRLKGALTIESYANYLRGFGIQTFPGGPFAENAGTLGANTSFPRWTLNNAATLAVGPVSVTGRWRHIAAMADSSIVTNPASTTAGVPAYDYFDLSARIALQKRFELRAGITNLANKAPPVVAGTPGSTNLGVYDGIGRSFFVGLKAHI